ncbi:glycerate kinase [Pinibacter soli]|uniref:Glycerate kinase n=1 Tax=Pinibacter soli TaxID=3044211 RepID=A0ABT6RA92_9BACT|nr:glycerate kinase [Pinibacter soli]MDI3319474.1 glycerate kinase [Pinibacter soli]
MEILIAPNAYKNSLTATEAANAIKLGFEQSKLACACTCFPIGDGGDGTGSLIIQHFAGERIPVTVTNPLGRPIASSFGLIEEGRTAIIEMADAAGLRLLSSSELHPLKASSRGTGAAMLEALRRGVKRIIIGMGGSATVDGGTGILQALGIRFLDAGGNLLSDLPAQLFALHSIDDTNLVAAISACEIIILCDVDNPLLGENGAAAVFGPQKGASSNDIAVLEKGLTIFKEVTERQKGVDMGKLVHGGTAGGAAAGLCAWLDAKLVNGTEYFLELTGFNKVLKSSSMLVTGEGSIDLQTLQGKAPTGAAQQAKSMGIPVLAFAGKIDVKNIDRLKEFFDILLPIGNGAGTLEEALSLTAANLTRTAREVGDLLALYRS